MNLNKVFIIGRFTQDVKLRTTPGGQSVTTVGIATTRTWNDKSGGKQEKTEFHNVVFWGKLAEIVGQYLAKGSLIFVEGRLETRSWDAPDGTKKYRTEIIAEGMQMGPKPGRTEGAGKSLPKEEKLPEIQLEESEAPDEINPDDVPF